MRQFKKENNIFSLSAIDIFASAMGAFVIISIILMQYYQKETISQIEQTKLQSLLQKSQAELSQVESQQSSLDEIMREIKKDNQTLGKTLAALRAQRQSLTKDILNQNRKKTPSESSTTTKKPGKSLVSFRFLGMKTNKMDFLILVDMSKYMADFDKIILRTIERILDSLGEEHKFGIMGFHQDKQRLKAVQWPSHMHLKSANKANKHRAIAFAKQKMTHFKGSSPVLGAMKIAMDSEAGAILLISDGLPNPKYNNNLSSMRLINKIARLNTRKKEIHTVAVGPYYKYKGAVAFMEGLANRNNGGFMAVAK